MNALVLHGFTGSLDTVAGLRAPLKARGIKVSMPILRGHGTESSHLHRVHWRDWAADGRKAMQRLLETSQEPVVIAGLSMGALVACHMAAEFPHRVRRLALIAPGFGFRSKLLRLLPLIKRMRRNWQATPDFVDPEAAKLNTNYPDFPLEALESVLDYVPIVEDLLEFIECPVGIFHSKKDPVIANWVPRKLQKRLGKDRTTVHLYKRSRHEMLLDIEAQSVIKDVVDYLCQDDSA